jgi:hypothetical protein
LKSAQQVFDKRQSFEFEKFPIGFCLVADRDPRHMMVWYKDDGLVEKEINIGMVYVKDSKFGRRLNSVRKCFGFHTLQ